MSYVSALSSSAYAGVRRVLAGPANVSVKYKPVFSNSMQYDGSLDRDGSQLKQLLAQCNVLCAEMVYRQRNYIWKLQLEPSILENGCNKDLNVPNGKSQASSAGKFLEAESLLKGSRMIEDQQG
ncbi:hypothetical protein TSUD_197220 [Trifolium subterraneum]|uniref:Uncharacterized protein n=1 Tax=Trifolium subterraneum TaxID=3900 RepID=A0A2Z6MCR8_TRISU|nr:hypothetical protein TSUD_197220 [Trifolium subterraneum]